MRPSRMKASTVFHRRWPYATQEARVVPPAAVLRRIILRKRSKDRRGVEKSHFRTTARFRSAALCFIIKMIDVRCDF